MGRLKKNAPGGRPRLFSLACLVLSAVLGAAPLFPARIAAQPKAAAEKTTPERTSPAANTNLAAPFPRLYRIPLRVHVGKSGRDAAAFHDILNEINEIWQSQAGICFETRLVTDDRAFASGFDIWFVPRIDGNDDWNGIFRNEHAIIVRDTPSLNPAPTPARHPAARTAAHEFGHALGLPHRQDSDDNLMRSKTFGWKLNFEEIAAARKEAAVNALPDSGERRCGPVLIDP